MTFIRHCCLFALLGCAAFAVKAQEMPPQADGAAKAKLSESVSKDFGLDIKPGDLMAMERFLSMPPDKMREVIRALEKIAALSDEERAQLVERMRSFRMMNDEKRNSLFYEFKYTSPRDRDLVKRYFQSLPKEQQQKSRDELGNMKGPQRLERHKELVQKAKEAGLEPNMSLSNVPGDDMPKNLKRGGGHLQIPGPAAGEPPSDMPPPATTPSIPLKQAGNAAPGRLPSPDEPPPVGQMP